jgi:phosphohistidine phosphatase
MEKGYKEVLFIRHAKSSWDNQNLSDLDRPLNERGHNTAPKMAAFIRNIIQSEHIEFVSSPAKRARATSKYFAEIFGIQKEDIHLYDNLYYGSELDYLECLQVLKKSTEMAFVFGHNPTIETITAKISNPYYGLVPTCGVFHTKTKEKSWIVNDFKDIELLNYYLPKVVLNL